MTNTSGAPVARTGRRLRGALIAFVVVAALVGVGLFIVGRYESSAKAIKAALTELEQRGQSLDAEGCVDATLAWNAECSAMKSLCDASVPRVLLACLGAADRGAWCESLGDRTSDTHFGYAECKARGLKGPKKKMCALAYRTIDGFCKKQPGAPAGDAEPVVGGSAPAPPPRSGTGR